MKTCFTRFLTLYFFILKSDLIWGLWDTFKRLWGVFRASFGYPEALLCISMKIWVSLGLLWASLGRLGASLCVSMESWASQGIFVRLYENFGVFVCHCASFLSGHLSITPCSTRRVLEPILSKIWNKSSITRPILDLGMLLHKS